MSAVVLDASALLALLKNERGRRSAGGCDDRHGQSGRGDRHFVRLGAPIAEIRMMLQGLPIRVDGFN